MIFLLPSVHQSVISRSYLQESLLGLIKDYKPNIDRDYILKIIRNLNVSKAHGHDDISITMLKIYDSVITEPLSLIF